MIREMMRKEKSKRDSNQNKMTHARAMWDECEPELLLALEPMQCAYI